MLESDETGGNNRGGLGCLGGLGGVDKQSCEESLIEIMTFAQRLE